MIPLFVGSVDRADILRDFLDVSFMDSRSHVPHVARFFRRPYNLCLSRSEDSLVIVYDVSRSYLFRVPTSNVFLYHVGMFIPRGVVRLSFGDPGIFISACRCVVTFRLFYRGSATVVHLRVELRMTSGIFAGPFARKIRTSESSLIHSVPLMIFGRFYISRISVVFINGTRGPSMLSHVLVIIGSFIERFLYGIQRMHDNFPRVAIGYPSIITPVCELLALWRKSGRRRIDIGGRVRR